MSREKNNDQAAQKLPHFTFDSRTLSPRQAVAEWHEQIGLFGDVRVLKGPGSGFHAHVEGYQLASLTFGSLQIAAQVFDRSRLRIARDGIDHYALRFYRKGSLFCRRTNEDKALRPGDLLITDLAETLQTTEPDVDVLWLVVPRAQLASRLRHPEGQNLRVVRCECATVRLLHDHLRAMLRHAPLMTVHDAPPLVGPTLDLAAAAINGGVSQPSAGGVPATLVDSICHYVRRHAGNPQLDAARLAAHFRISRRKLSYLFEESGGVAAYIQMQRLHLARRRLADPAFAHLKIAEVSAGLGFSHRSSFTRAFERLHGLSPRQVRALAKERTNGAPARGPRDFWRRWLMESQ